MSFHEESAANNPNLYTIGGITYNENMVPVKFSDDYEGPKNALVGSITASNGETYGVYADYLQNNNEGQNSSGDVLATEINVNSTGTNL